MEWTFLTNHAHVLVCLDADPGGTQREIETAVGLADNFLHFSSTAYSAHVVGLLVGMGLGRHYRNQGIWVKCPQCGPPFDPNLPCVGDACP